MKTVALSCDATPNIWRYSVWTGPPRKQMLRWMLEEKKFLSSFFFSLLTNSYVCVLVAQSCPTLCNPMNCSLPGSSVHGVSQARILKWVAIPFSRRSSWFGDLTWVSHTVGRFCTVWTTWEAQLTPRIDQSGEETGWSDCNTDLTVWDNSTGAPEKRLSIGWAPWWAETLPSPLLPHCRVQSLAWASQKQQGLW